MVRSTRESLDTNIILRLILQDVPEQCLRIVDLMMRHGVVYVVANLAITEVVFTLQKRYAWPRQEIVKMLKTVLEEFEMDFDREMMDLVFPLYLKYPSLSFNDCCLAVRAELDGVGPLWTFDKDLAKKTDMAKLVK